MANSGYITSSGIQQIFTSGPFIGTEVTSSYMVDGISFGPIIDLKQPFISGSIDTLYESNTLFSRYYQDLITCPPNGCNIPIIVNINPICNPYNYLYYVGSTYLSGSIIPEFTVIEYSISDNFNINTGSYTQDNSSPSIPPIDVSNLSYLPTAYTNVYFRAYSICGDITSSLTSSYSNIYSSSCDIPIISLPTITYIPESTQETNYEKIIEYKIEGEPETIINFSTSNLNPGRGGGLVYITNLEENSIEYLSFINPISGYYIIPTEGFINLRIYSKANSIPGINYVELTLTFKEAIPPYNNINPDGVIQVHSMGTSTF